ncbi:MAG: malto-oligosyltrehalose synthase [Gammaproteobacteria bacterium]|nr:malto-oligosyltrehalose synthase [Gammaproteobacteria bacterium]
MSTDDDLQSHAAALGIASGFHDIQGRWQTPSATALRALVECLARGPAESARDARGWPTVVVRRRDRLEEALALSLVAPDGPGRLSVELQLEDGSVATCPPRLASVPGTAAPGALACTLHLPMLPEGYHRLRLYEGEQVLADTPVIVAPARCYLPPVLADAGRLWGPAVQLYALRSERNWGIGDFTDLRGVIEHCAARGAGLVGLNPLHALFLDEPGHASPYSPSTRLFLNPLYLDVERSEDLQECAEARALLQTPDFLARLQQLREAPLVDYAAVTAVKLQVLGLLHASFRERHLAPGDTRGRAFERWRQARGAELRRHAVWAALREHFGRTPGGTRAWQAWPDDYRDPDAAAVTAFATGHAERVEFFEYLQWQADVQLAELAARARQLGLPVGLYGDAAVSVDRAGSDVWAHQSWFALDASIGAPPDDFSLDGQDWGLPPWYPAALQAEAYAPFIALLRSGMRHMGALRIDHVMGLLRLYWIVPGGNARDGAYVHYPLDDLLAVLALESHRHRCVVIGEDLGTVPDDVRRALADAGVLSYRLLFFERDHDGDFRAPGDYPAQALVAASTHDLPTLAGFWEGADLALRAELALFPSDETRQRQIVARADARARLLLLLERQGLLPDGVTADPQSLPRMTAELSRAVHVLLARTPAKLLLVQLEDVLGMRDQANVPGTVEAHPNWRRKLELTLERWPQDERFVALCAALHRERPPQRAAPADTGAVTWLSIPRATYRVQLNREFTFLQARAIVPLLARLGVSHLYCSPILRARPGSAHGYDIVAHDQLNHEIGSAADFAALVDALHAAGMGLIVDIVPNHMGVMGADNEWWLNVLEHGPAAVCGDFFDIDWQAADARVLLPVLGDHYGSVLESGAFKLVLVPDDGTISVWYHQHRFPLDPATYPELLERSLRLAPPQTITQAAQEAVESLAAGLSQLPPRTATSASARYARRRDSDAHKARLAALLRDDAAFALGMELALARYNGHVGEAESFDALHELLERQAYRLAYWRVAADEINYRRFFDINDLAGLRVEVRAVFDATHRYLLDLVADGRIDGLRIDHPDGLYDPARYFSRLQEYVAVRRGAQDSALAHGELPLYVIAEKILAPHEALPRDWAVHGTTGYEFANLVNGLFIDGRARTRLDRCYRSFVGDTRQWDEVVYESKREVIESSLASELTVLSARLLRIARADRHTRDFTLDSLRRALTEVVACFPVYRTYVQTDPAGVVSPADRRYIDWAIGSARRRARAADASLFAFLRSVLLGENLSAAPAAVAAQTVAFIGRFQQYTAPVCAKGVEDTAFYRYLPLASANEVGGGSDAPGTTTAGFHRENARRLQYWPHSMLAGSTHDTKRGEDVRVRIDALTEMPAAWRLALRRWSRLNRSRKRAVDGAAAPTRKDEYLLYQTLLGSFPDGELHDGALAVYRARIASYMIKAVREAKTQSSWMNADSAYERAVTDFVDGLLGRLDGNRFLDDFLPLQRRVAAIGAINSLSQTLLRLTAPGVPDIYQGSECRDYPLVDPDNRRPLDPARLAHTLDRLAARTGVPGPQDLDAKPWLMQRVLHWRSGHARVFRDGDYLPLTTLGPHAGHLVAFARRHDDDLLVVVVPRLVHALLAEGAAGIAATAWDATAVQIEADWPDEFHAVLHGSSVRAGVGAAGRILRAADLLADFPVALLVGRLSDTTRR